MGCSAKEMVLFTTKGNLLTYNGYLLFITQGFETVNLAISVPMSNRSICTPIGGTCPS